MGLKMLQIILLETHVLPDVMKEHKHQIQNNNQSSLL